MHFLKDDDAAQYCYEQAKEIRQHEAKAINNLANLEYEKENFEEAAILYLQSLELDIEDADCLCNLGLALSNTKYKDYAKLAFEEAVNADQGSTVILFNYLLFLLE